MTTKPPPPSGNPAFRALGLPTLRAKLPSRPWLIFLTISTTITATILHDRREARKVQGRWCSAVQHLSREPLSTLELPRKVTVYLSAPPGDGIGPAREYFVQYVKPIFTAAALEYDVVEGRRGGEVRWRVAERVRKVRSGNEAEEDEAVQEIRRRNGVRRVGVQGEVVVGRHAWKEYVRGVHEGWLGPLEAPSELVKTVEGEEENKKPAVPLPYILPETYPSVTALPESIPDSFDPVAVIPHAHVLGFLNTPVRLYRFFNHRHTAHVAGREAAAVALGAYYRPFDLEGGEVDVGCAKEEEREWPKSVWKEGPLEITQEVVVDQRIGERMRRFVLPEGLEPASGEKV